MKNEKKKRVYSTFKEELDTQRERAKKEISEKMQPILHNIERQFSPLGTIVNGIRARDNNFTSSALGAVAKSIREMQSRISNPISDFSVKLTDINQKISTAFLPTVESINTIKLIPESTQRVLEAHVKQINVAMKSLDEIYKTRFIPERIFDLDAVIITPPPPQVIHHHHHHFYPNSAVHKRVNGYIYLDNSTGSILILDLKGTVLHCPLAVSLMWLLNALVDSPTNIITKSMAISEGQRWDICMTKYHRINEACYCKLVHIGPKENSLQLDLKAIPKPLAKIGKFEVDGGP